MIVEWWKLVYANEKHLRTLPSYAAATRALQSDDRVARHLGHLVGVESMVRIDAERVLDTLIIQYLELKQGLAFGEDNFADLYLRIETYFNSDRIEYRYLAPVDRFEMDDARIELRRDLAIIRLPEADRQHILLDALRRSAYLGTPLVPHFATCALEMFFESPKHFDVVPDPSEDNLPRGTVQSTFDGVVEALRLFKSGNFGFSGILVTPTNWDPYGETGAYLRSAHQPSMGSPYHLAARESSEFRTFWERCQKLGGRRHRRVETAVRRLTFGYERMRAEDRLIDYLIGFEALLLDGRGELEYRLSLRAAWLLGTDAAGRRKVFAELRAAYGERSTIVHGGAPSSDVKVGQVKVPFGTFVDSIEEYLRRAVLELLNRIDGQSVEQVLGSLDESILSGAT